MKCAKTLVKVVCALAVLAGVVYLIVAYGDKIAAWAKGLMEKCPCCKKPCSAEEEAPVEAEAAAEAAPVEEAPAEEAAVEAAPAEEAPVEEVPAAPAEEAPVVVDDAPIADESDFVG